MTTRSSFRPYRDALAAAVERAEGLARENAVLRTNLTALRFDWLQWSLVGVIAMCGVAITGIVLTGR
jgi:hypothetical protein